MTNKQENGKSDSDVTLSMASLFGRKTKREFENVVPNDNFLYFHKKNIIFRHLIDSCNKFIEEDVKNYLEHEGHIFTENVITNDTIYKHRFKFENIRTQELISNNNVDPLSQSMTRNQNLTYSLKIFADVVQYQDVIDISSGKKDTNVVGIPEKNKLVAIIPLMIRSKGCSLAIHIGVDKNECD